MAKPGQNCLDWLVQSLVTRVTLLGFMLPNIFPCPVYPLDPTSYEVIIPRRLDSNYNHSGHLSYLIKMAEKDYVIHLRRRNRFVAPNLPVFTYDSQGQRMESYPHIPDECYYEGYVDGLADSFVALKTCLGLKGLLKTTDRSYGIEPLQGSPTFQHLLFLTTGLEASFGNYCAVTAEEDQAKEPRRQHKRESLDPRKPKYIELYIVVDHFTFQRESSNETRVLQAVLDVINIVDLHFDPLHTGIALIGLEIWNLRNLINITNEVTLTLNQFNFWRSNVLTKLISHDTAYLIADQHFPKSCGKSYMATICRPDFSAGVVSYVRGNPALFATVFSHEIGHHIGLDHDNPRCVCGGRKKCIMYSSGSGSDQFSNCSIQEFYELVMSGNMDCLTNIPKKITTFSTCGNGLLDEGEECDCGGIQKCKLDNCCTLQCLFKPGAVCSSGRCCRNCHFMPKGYVCRIQANECDLPEYCSGDSPWCPNDFYVQDGTPCTDGKSYCYKKHCWTRKFLCNRLFGDGTEAAPARCFQLLNALGNAYGNCGRSSQSGTFLKCPPEDVMCGRVHCTEVMTIPRLPGYTLAVQFPKVEPSCWSVAFTGMEDSGDLGEIPDGAPCGAKKFCINRSCVDLPRMACNPLKKCWGRGVCNNHQNCHCNYGWAPPHCQYWGSGGSSDGGYPVLKWGSTMMKRVFGTIIPVSVLLLSIIISMVPKIQSLKAWASHQWRKRRQRRKSGSSIGSENAEDK